MRLNTRALVALLLASILVLPANASETTYDTPEKVAKALLDAIIARDGKAALACLVKAERESKEVQEEFARKPGDDGSTVKYEIGKTKTSGAAATVEVTLNISAGKNQQTMKMIVVCEKEGEGWRVNWGDTLNKTSAANPEQAREGRIAEGRAALGSIKDQGRVYYARTNKAPLGFADLKLKAGELELRHWRVEENFRVGSSPEMIIIEAHSLEHEDVLMVRANLKDGTTEWLGDRKDVDPAESKEEIDSLLKSCRDVLRVAHAKTGKVPATLTGAGDYPTIYDLVGDYWLVANEISANGNTVTLRAEAIDEAKVATLEFDISKGGGEVKVARAYMQGDVSKHTKANVEMAEISKALNIHKLETGDYPDSLDAIKDQFAGKTPVDPFTKKAYLYEVTETGFNLKSLGRDGKVGGRWTPDKDIIYNERGLAD